MEDEDEAAERSAQDHGQGDAQSGKAEAPEGPSPSRMLRFVVEGLVFALLLAPALYLRSMKRSPHPWFSAESFNNLGTILVVVTVLLILVRIGSYRDRDEDD